MSKFFPYKTILVQFREPGRNHVPEGIQNLGVETKATREARRRKTPMVALCRRNGASFAKVAARLAAEGFTLVHACAQQRHALKDSKAYTLTTFVFSRDRQSATDSLAEVFAAAARRRYEYVQVSKGTDDQGHPLLSMVAKTTAHRAAELKYINDAEANAYGFVVSKAVRKEDRATAASAPVPQSAQAKQSAPKPVPQRSVSNDPQLDRLMAAGWKVDTEKTAEPGKVFLFRINAAGNRGELVHHCAKKKAGQRKRT